MLQIKEVLTEVKQADRMKHMELEKLQWLESFLKPFRDVTNDLEGQLYPTLPLVLPASCNLREHCLPQLEDTAAEEAMRTRAYNLLLKKFNPTMKQKVATFLVPAYRQLLMLDEPERNEVLCFHHIRYVPMFSTVIIMHF
jgi:hypothetical protein